MTEDTAARKNHVPHACGVATPACLRMLLWHIPGLFVVHKPSGPSSFDVIRSARRELGVQKIGHAGTLDPLAEGVLVLGVGRATRLLGSLADSDKEYRASLVLGVRTDTYDSTGTVTVRRDPSAVDRAQFEAALAPLRGAIEQVPPMYSALKKEGRPLYEYAREGREVVRRARSVVVTRLEVVAFENPAAVIDIECSKGTYVRSLVDDMGQALGCGAAMTALCRTRVGPFVLGQARRLGSLLARCSG